jgi:hypothetical protein
VSPEEIADASPSRLGCVGPKTFIPIVRGGAAPYVKPNHWYVGWSVDAVKEYQRKGKNPARFQNSAFYFREGIGIPMVSSGRVTGALLDTRVFDPAIVGIFPKDPNLRMYFLGLFNSPIATDLVRQINPTANNSANYLKRLPIVLPSSNELSFIDPLVQQAVDQARQSASIDENLRREIDAFYSQLWCRSGTCA